MKPVHMRTRASLLSALYAPRHGVTNNFTEFLWNS